MGGVGSCWSAESRVVKYEVKRMKDEMAKTITVYETPDELIQAAKEKSLHLVITANNLALKIEEDNTMADFNNVTVGRLLEKIFGDFGIVLRVNPGTRKA